MKGIERLLPASALDAMDFVLFSLDPGRDTPQALKAFARDHGLDASRWRLLATNEEGVLDLAAALGVKHRRDASGEIAHSAIIFVVDAVGVIRHRQVGLGDDPSDLIEALTAVVGASS
jgi:protein SCO1/2